MKDETTSGPAVRSGGNRNQTIDFFRGLGLWILFVDHLQPNVWSHFTLAQFGFSDFAEIFVFISGYVNAGMYERAFRSGGITAALGKLGTREAKIYTAHIATMVAGFAILAGLASRGVRLDEPGLYLWMAQPVRYLVRTLVLLYSPNEFALLPLYLVLSPVALIAVVGLRRWPDWFLAGSFALWCVSQFRVIDLQVMREAWYYQPLAWQFLLVLGIASKMYWADVKPVVKSRTAVWLAIVFVLAAFLLKTATLIGPVQEWLFGLVPFSARLLGRNSGKPHLAPFRLVHFLSLVILIIAIPWDWQKWRESQIARLAITAGRHSLFIYSVSVVMAIGMNLFLKRLDGGPLLQFAFCAFGICVISGIAYVRDKFSPRSDL
jgi:hypothetical protein